MSHLVSSKSSNIAGIFLVSFDELHGPSILFSKSSGNLDIGNIKWKAIVSGHHLVNSDIVFFGLMEHSLCGVAVFRKLRTTVGRGGIMCSVGVLTNQINSLFKHTEFCTTAVQSYVTHLKNSKEKSMASSLSNITDTQTSEPSPTHNTDTPPLDSTDIDIDILQKYWDKFGMSTRERPPARISLSSFEPSKKIGGGKTVMDLSSIDQFPPMTFRGDIICNTVKQHASFISLHQFISLLGSKFITLWKAVMLQKRILFLCPPPVLMGCCAVFWTIQLGDTNNISPNNLWANAPRIDYVPTPTIYSKKWTRPSNIQPLFNITLSDIDYIRRLGCYVACTSDEMFREKPNLYDVLIDLRPTASGSLSSSRGLTPSISQASIRFRAGSYLSALSDEEEESDTPGYSPEYDSLFAPASSETGHRSSVLSTSSSLSNASTKRHRLTSSDNSGEPEPTLTTPLLQEYTSSSTPSQSIVNVPSKRRPPPTMFIPNTSIATILRTTHSDTTKKTTLASKIRGKSNSTHQLLEHIGEFNNPIFAKFPSAILLQDDISKTDITNMGLKIPFSSLGIPFCFCQCCSTSSFCVQCWIKSGRSSDLLWLKELMLLWGWEGIYFNP